MYGDGVGFCFRQKHTQAKQLVQARFETIAVTVVRMEVRVIVQRNVHICIRICLCFCVGETGVRSVPVTIGQKDTFGGFKCNGL